MGFKYYVFGYRNKKAAKKVIVGYASHQLLSMALAKCDAIASGNFLNLRWFQPEHFETIDENQPSRRAVWYYCPQALSEYKIPFLDIAKRMKLLDRIEPPDIMKNSHSEMLFKGSLPSSTGLSEKGIRGQDRDFTEILDVNRAAIAAIDMAFQFPLSQEWNIFIFWIWQRDWRKQFCGISAGIK